MNKQTAFCHHCNEIFNIEECKKISANIVGPDSEVDKTYLHICPKCNKPIDEVTTGKEIFMVTIQEVFIRTVAVHASDAYEANELVENLCNDLTIDLDYESFAGRKINVDVPDESFNGKWIHEQFIHRN